MTAGTGMWKPPRGIGRSEYVETGIHDGMERGQTGNRFQTSISLLFEADTKETIQKGKGANIV
jgi:hypothetical protein